MTWIANLLVLVGLILIGGRQRLAFVFTFVGESLWVVAGVQREEYDLAAICVVFAVIALVNWWRWGTEEVD